MASPLQSPSRPIKGVLPLPSPPRVVQSDLEGLITQGARFCPVGSAPKQLKSVLALGYRPRVRIDFLNASIFLSDYRYDDYINFLVAYVALWEGPARRVRRVHPRIFYKDSSLVWRVASHYIDTQDEYWIGKGEVRFEEREDGEYCFSIEETTNLPFEIQNALDLASRRKKPVRDEKAVPLFLQRGPLGRIEPYREFTEPRRRAESNRAINRGKPIARFTRKNDPSSLVFTKGFEPDFARGVIEVDQSKSRLYGGAIEKTRVLSTNAQVQYQFVSSPTHVFLNSPQTLDPELTSFGIRALDVQADEDIFMPGYEFHFLDEDCDPPALYSQIPAGFAGPPSTTDPSRADASAWIEALPVVREFRRTVLARARRRRKA